MTTIVKSHLGKEGWRKFKKFKKKFLQLNQDFRDKYDPNERKKIYTDSLIFIGVKVGNSLVAEARLARAGITVPDAV